MATTAVIQNVHANSAAPLVNVLRTDANALILALPAIGVLLITALAVKVTYDYTIGNALRDKQRK